MQYHYSIIAWIWKFICTITTTKMLLGHYKMLTLRVHNHFRHNTNIFVTRRTLNMPFFWWSSFIKMPYVCILILILCTRMMTKIIMKYDARYPGWKGLRWARTCVNLVYARYWHAHGTPNFILPPCDVQWTRSTLAYHVYFTVYLTSSVPCKHWVVPYGRN